MENLKELQYLALVSKITTGTLTKRFADMTVCGMRCVRARVLTSCNDKLLRRLPPTQS